MVGLGWGVRQWGFRCTVMVVWIFRWGVQGLCGMKAAEAEAKVVEKRATPHVAAGHVHPRGRATQTALVVLRAVVLRVVVAVLDRWQGTMRRRGGDE